MRIVPVGTCIQGPSFKTWAPPLIERGFECFAICFHMSLSGIDLNDLADEVRAIIDGTGVKISALGFYSNPIQYPDHAETLKRCIDIAEKFGTGTVSTFAGGYEGKPVEEAMPAFGRVFGELTRRAEDKGVKIAIENCPMGGTWQSATCNIGYTPRAWEMMFNEVKSDALGLEWEPTHQMHQLIDPVANLRRFASKVIHIHGKDATIKRDLIEEHGIVSRDSYINSRFPGFGDTDWRQIFDILYDHDYQGMISIEGYHDNFFIGDYEMTGQLHALNYLKWCRGGSYVENPWSKA